MLENAGVPAEAAAAIAGQRPLPGAVHDLAGALPGQGDDHLRVLAAFLEGLPAG